MGLLDRFSPGQRQALMYGVPAVAGLVVASKLFGKAKTPGASTAPAGTAVPSTDAVGVGQLADFESQVADQISALAAMWAAQPQPPAPVAPKPPPPPVDTHPAPPPYPPNGQVVQLVATGVPGVYAAPVPGQPGVVVGQAPAGPFVYGGTQGQAGAVLNPAAPGPPPNDSLTFDDPFIWDKPWP